MGLIDCYFKTEFRYKRRSQFDTEDDFFFFFFLFILSWIYFMKNQSYVLSHLSVSYAEIKTCFDVWVHISSDNAREYMSNSFKMYMT